MVNNTKVLIVGLGLMGGAYALRLSKKGYDVYGTDLNPDAIKFALENEYIKYGDVNPENYIGKMDMIILCIYPQAILNFLRKYKKLFKENQVITDICGVKSQLVPEAYRLAKPAVYYSHHPMAGREKVGIEYSHLCVFDEANFLITSYYSENKDAEDKLRRLGTDLGFGRITIMDIYKHDRMIGFTSQLTHAIAVSLVNSDHDADTKNFIGDSYRDLTRIAMINDSLWSELFLENRANLLTHIESFEMELKKLKQALYDDNKDALCDLFKSSTLIRKEMEK